MRSKIVLIAVISSLILSGCVSSNKPKKSDIRKQNSINILVCDTQNKTKYELKEYTKLFEKKYKINVELDYIEVENKNDYKTKLSSKLYSGYRPELIYIHNTSEMLEDLSDTNLFYSKEILKNKEKLPDKITQNAYIPVGIIPEKLLFTEEDLTKMNTSKEEIKNLSSSEITQLMFYAEEDKIKLNPYIWEDIESIAFRKSNLDLKDISLNWFKKYVEETKSLLNFKCTKDFKQIELTKRWNPESRVSYEEYINKIEKGEILNTLTRRGYMYNLNEEASFGGTFSNGKEDIYLVDKKVKKDNLTGVHYSSGLTHGFLITKNSNKEDLAIKYVDFMLTDEIQQKMLEEAIESAEGVYKFGSISKSIFEFEKFKTAKKADKEAIEHMFKRLEKEESNTDGIYKLKYILKRLVKEKTSDLLKQTVFLDNIDENKIEREIKKINQKIELRIKEKN